MNDLQQALTSLRSYLKENSLRCTPEREEIVQAVLELDDHFTVAQVADTVQTKGGKTSLTTIYRNMDHLQRAGLVSEVKCGKCGDEQVYEQLSMNHHHDHLTCIICGKVVEFENEAIEVLQSHVAEKYGFELVRHYLDLQGVCRSCREKVKH